MSRTNTRLARRQEPKYVKRRQRGLAIVIASALLLVGALGYIGYRVLGGGNDYQGTGNGEMELIEIPQGASLSEMGPQLEEKDVVKSNGAFQAAAARNPNASRIQPGFYRLEKQMSAEEAVAALLDDENQVGLIDVTGGATLQDVNVIGGDVRYGIFSLIEQATCDQEPCVSRKDLEHAAAESTPEELGVPEWAREPVAKHSGDPKRLEGLIAPGEYAVNPDHSAKEILTDLITRSAKQYNDTGIVKRAEAVGLKPYGLLTAASLVEREAPAGEFDKVARVILNRLDEPMRLEFDSTVNYDLNEVEVATKDEDRERKTPWNTYAKEGLPETPIASPSTEAIEAMEHPAEGAWKFFVTVDEDGTTVFSDDFEEHQKNVDRAMESGILDHRARGAEEGAEPNPEQPGSEPEHDHPAGEQPEPAPQPAAQ